ncbi:MAG: PAS domain S-box protein [Bacillota bacterium]
MAFTRGFFDMLPLATLLLQDGTIKMANLRAAEFLGYSAEALLHKRISEIVLPEDGPHMEGYIANFLAEKAGYSSDQFRVADGRIVRAMYSLVDYEGGPAILLQLINVTHVEQMERLKAEIKSLRERENKYRELFNNANNAMILIELDERGLPGCFIEVNDAACRMYGYSRDEFFSLSPNDLLAEKNQEKRSLIIKDILEKKYFTIEAEHLNKEGALIPVEIRGHISEVEGSRMLFLIIRDITDKKCSQEEFNLQKLYFKQLFQNSPEAIAMLDGSGGIINVNSSFEGLFQYSVNEIKGQPVNNVIVPEDLLEEACVWFENIIEGQVLKKETLRKRRDGSLVNVSLIGFPVFYNDRHVGIFAIYSDITKRRQAEEQMKFLSLHDPLTGLYNRAYFEEEMRRIQAGRYSQISIILCDIDGLKFVNDTLGNGAGDELLTSVAGIIRDSFRDGDIIARIGGDEFGILLPSGDCELVKRASTRIIKAVERYNGNNPKIPLSLSVGSATSDGPVNIVELFKEADNNMYREKLHRSQSARSSIVQALMKALEARDFITEGHADRLQDLVVRLATAVGLPNSKITDLRLLARFHDIGKVGIPDRILLKPGPLTFEEFAEMKKHTEIGHRIAETAHELAPISDWILKHHEWWNGEGYPLGLNREEIPLECRILSIVDSYDAMTSDRPYRKAMKHSEAVEELKKCAGTQLDPHLVPVFLKVVDVDEKE